jgi:hypothetical protein
VTHPAAVRLSCESIGLTYKCGVLLLLPCCSEFRILGSYLRILAATSDDEAPQSRAATVESLAEAWPLIQDREGRGTEVSRTQRISTPIIQSNRLAGIHCGP